MTLMTGVVVLLLATTAAGTAQRIRLPMAPRMLDKRISKPVSAPQDALEVRHGSMTVTIPKGTRAGDEGQPLQFTIFDAQSGTRNTVAFGSHLVRVDEVLFFNRRLLFLGVNGAGERTVTIADATAGRILTELTCADLFVSEDNQALSFRRPDGQRVSFNVGLMKLSVSGGPEALIRVLEGDDLVSKMTLLSTLRSNGGFMIREAVVRDALERELARAVTEDQRESRRRAMGAGETSERRMQRRQYFDDVLVPLASSLGDPRYTFWLARADSLAARGFMANLDARGHALRGLDEIEGALRSPVPVGYSDDYQAGLIFALARFAERYARLPPESYSRVAAITRGMISSSSNGRAVREAMLLADDIDDDVSVAMITKLVAEVPDPRRFNGSVESARLVTEAAVRLLSRRRTAESR